MKISKFTNLCFLIVVLVVSIFTFSANACITAELVPPKDIAENIKSSQSQNVDRTASILDLRADSFRHDKEYYDWIVNEFCTQGSGINDEQKKEDQIIMNAIIEKWKQK